MPDPTTNKIFVPLENNPDTMTSLAHALGFSKSYTFHDVLSLSTPRLLPLPSPCHALLFIFPVTPVSEDFFYAADAARTPYTGAGPAEPVLFYYQLIGHACGLYGLLHCLTNVARQDPSTVIQGSILDQLIQTTIPMDQQQRAQHIYDSPELERLHVEHAQQGDTVPPLAEEYADGNGFIAFVKGLDGKLYELESRANGPIDLGVVHAEDLLAEEVMERGPLQHVKREMARGELADLGFSCIALCKDE